MKRNTITPNGATSVPALRRAVAILDLLTQREDPLNSSEIGRALNLPKSTLHGLLQVMCEMDLTKKNMDGTYCLGSHPLRWSNGFLAQNDLVAEFKDYFSTKPEYSKYTMTMTVLDRDEVAYIACSNSNIPLGVTFRIGMRLPAAFTATGKALLETLDKKELAALFSDSFPAPLTSRSVRNFDQLKKELVKIQAQGFSVDDGQVREGMICLGTTIRNHESQAIAGLAISLTRSEATNENITKLGERLKIAAADLSRKLGYVPPRNQ